MKNDFKNEADGQGAIATKEDDQFNMELTLEHYLLEKAEAANRIVEIKQLVNQRKLHFIKLLQEQQEYCQEINIEWKKKPVKTKTEREAMQNDVAYLEAMITEFNYLLTEIQKTKGELPF